ncbi:MAG: tetratricopeptide repeat protein [Gallionellaceae bacterium]
MNSTLGNAIQTALAHHKAGHLPQAEAIYRKILQVEPRHPDALHFLGLIAQQAGKLDVASELIGRAIEIRPSSQMYFNRGILLQAQGNLDQAIESYQQALLLKPDFAEAYDNLGTALQEQGKLDEAIADHRQALIFKPDLAGAHFNLGNALQKLGRLDQAIESYHQALLLNPNLAWAQGNMGNALRTQGRLDEAIISFRQAIALKPDFAEAHCNLGNVLRTQGRLDEAIISFRQAIALKPDIAEAHCNLGNVLRDQGRLDEAMTCYRQAIALKPDFAEVHCNIARQLIDLGQFEAAHSEISKVQEFEPLFPLTWAMLTRVRKMTQEDEDWLNTTLRLLSSPTLQDMERVALQFALGKYYDDIKQYDLAFPAYQQANILQRQIEGSFDRAAHARLSDAVIAAYPFNFRSRGREAASPSQLPVLVVGMWRSGTSLTEQIIASHPDAFGAGELNFWPGQFMENQSDLLSGNYGAPLISRLATQYEQYLRRYSADAIRIVDKMPDNFIRLGLIHEVFPHAKIVHVRRNPVDTCLSIYFQYLTHIDAFATDLQDIAFYYREYARLMQHWRKVLPADCFMEIAYEDLIGDQPEWSRRIIEFIGLEWDERCQDFHQTERRVGTASNWQVRQPIYQTSKARWRHYEKYLGPLLELQDLPDA